jgi:hypothetical protein
MEMQKVPAERRFLPIVNMSARKHPPQMLRMKMAMPYVSLTRAFVDLTTVVVKQTWSDVNLT